VLFFVLYSFTFCLSNQIVGVQEDRVNKPDRPLPRGMVSMQGAWTRWVLASAIYTFVGWSFGVLAWTLLWQGVTVVHNLMGGARSWFIKNLSMGLGVLAALEAGWRMAAPMTQSAWEWTLFLSVSVFVLVPLQDLRDIEGDKLSHRNTFPMAFGIMPTRIFLSVGFAALAVLTHLLLMRLSGPRLEVLICDAMLGLVSVVIAIRVLAVRNPQADHKTYIQYTYWYCVALATAIVAL
jgi:4-hydroxybenzoate polyprenyltransferase